MSEHPAECRMRYNPVFGSVEITLLNKGAEIRTGHTLMIQVEEWRQIVRRVETELSSQDKGTDR